MEFFDKYKQRSFEIEMFCNNNIFTVTFDQFNASLLNKSGHFFQILTDHKLLTGSVW